jgi:hypothetical protein
MTGRKAITRAELTDGAAGLRRLLDTIAAGELAAPAGTVVNADQKQERVVKLKGESQATCPSDFEPNEAVTEAGDDPGNRVSEDPDLLTFLE